MKLSTGWVSGVVTHRFPIAALFLAIAVPALCPAATPCTQIPPIDPTKGFVANFNNSCYTLPLTVGSTPLISGDMNAIYDEIYYQVTPGYELVILGTYPNARFMLASVYDDHLYPVGDIVDSAMLPMASNMINPFRPGVPYQPNQVYGFKVTFGGGAPVNISAGCSLAATNIEKNVLDASQIHQGITWAGFPNLPPGFPTHETGANAAGIVMIRKYADIDFPPINEKVLVRSLANGCAIPIQQALQANIISAPTSTSGAWMHMAQVNAHVQFVNPTIEPWLCFQNDTQNSVIWYRNAEYIPVLDTYDPFIRAALTTKQMQSVLSGQAYMRVQFQAPTTPSTPCANASCSLTGNEQARFVSLSLQGPQQGLAGPVTVFSIDDRSFVKDPNGNVTLVIGFGAPQPPNVTAANYYTWLDLKPIPNIGTVNMLRFRDLYPNPSFACSTGNVPNRTAEYNPVGGYMGNYVPVVDFPVAAQIPALPSPPNRPNSCYDVPTGPPSSSCTATIPGN